MNAKAGRSLLLASLAYALAAHPAMADPDGTPTTAGENTNTDNSQPAPPPRPAIIVAAPAAPAPAATAPIAAGPVIELPVDAPIVQSNDGDPSIVSGQSPNLQLGNGRRTSIGAYGEAQYFLQGSQSEITLRRAVLFFGHRFDDRFSVYTELEVENVSDFEIEQSYVEAQLTKNIGMRFGLVLIPLGIINLYHEPPTFNGVDRPIVDQLILPSTWRELGAGFFGTIAEGLHFQLYVVDGSDGSKFNAAGGIGPGLNRGFHVNTENAAVAGRLNFNRVLGLEIAAGFYYGTANNSNLSLEGIRVGIVEADMRFSRYGITLRAEYARVFVSGADQLTQAAITSGVPDAGTIGSAEQGFYAEAGYNLLHKLPTSHALIPFARYEYVDTRAALPSDIANQTATDALQYATVGLTYRPRLEIAFKIDYRRRLAGDDLLAADRLGIGVGFMY